MDLLDENHSMTSPLLENMDEMKADVNEQNDKTRAYAQNAPKILLETITARTALIILVSTYIIFLFGFIYDLRDTVRSFEDGNRYVSGSPCILQNISVDDVKGKLGDFGCTFSNYNGSSLTWFGHIDELSNVISIELQATQLNFTVIKLNGTDVPIDIANVDLLDELYFSYDVDLFGCYDNINCDWEAVLTLRHVKINIQQLYRAPEKSALLIVFGNTFQNQEALPTQGKVRSYLARVQYYGMNYGVFDGSQEVKYEFLTVTRPASRRGNIFLSCLLCSTVIVAITYCRAVYNFIPIFGKWLPEQKWLVFYFLALILYQNPLYCWICWQKLPPESWLIFLSYSIDAFAQASFLIIWLLFSDGLRRQTNFLLFYIPKFFMGLLIFLTYMGILVLQFPSITPVDGRSPIESVNNWSYNIKLIFISLSIAFLLLMWAWTLLWFYSLYYTGQALQRLPYMNTRYLQLSFRFFCYKQLL